MKIRFNPIIIALAIPLIAIAFALGSVFLKTSSVASQNVFPYTSYIDDSASLAGNTYSLKAQIDSQLAFDPDRGRLVSVRMQTGNKIALVIPAGLAENIQAGQKYNFTVYVEKNGALIVKSKEKF